MCRVLHIMAGADAGGISSVMLNYYQHMDRDSIHFDIALTTDALGKNGERFEQLGAAIYRLPLKSQGLRAFDQALSKLLSEGLYDAVHVHENETSYVALKIAKRLGIPCRIAHAHTTSPYLSIRGEIRRLSGCLLNCHYATRVIGCGKIAGERIFGRGNMKHRKAMILPNAVDIDKFAFQPVIREDVRKTLGVPERFVIGMVGRLATEKNYLFALDIMAKIHTEMPTAMLLIAGNGPEEEVILQKIQSTGMQEYVRLLGRREDVDQLYMAFDLFLLPSLFEGFPVAAVEAAASGLPTLLADTITNELAMDEAIHYLPLDEVDRWVKTVQSYYSAAPRVERTMEMRRRGLDICNNTRLLESIYLSKEM